MYDDTFINMYIKRQTKAQFIVEIFPDGGKVLYGCSMK